MIWNTSKECMSRAQMRELQGKRLQKLVVYVYHNVPFYRQKMQEMDLSPDDIRSIDDIVKLPLPPSRICVIIILTDFRRLLLQRLYVYMPLPEPPEIQPLWDIPGGILLYGQK